MNSKTITYPEFLTYVKHSLEALLKSGTKVILHKVIKNNNLELDGISIMDPGEHVSPTIYLNDFYQEYLDGADLAFLVSSILNIHRKNNVNIPFHIDDFRRYDIVKKMLACKLIHYESNKKLLKELPHKRFLDMAQIFYVMVKSDKTGTASITVRHEHIKLWNITEHQLIHDATENAPRILPAEIAELNNIIQEFLDEDARLSDISPEYEGITTFASFEPGITPSRLPMYVLSNCCRINGAAALLYPGILHEFAERMNTDIFIIPCSIHEVILVPDYGSLSKDALNSMVQEVNHHEVNEQDRLSDHVYYYQLHSKTFHI